MSRALVALLAFAGAGGCSRLADPCDGKPAACIGVHLDNNIPGVDTLAVTAADLGKHPSRGPFEFPVRFAVLLPPATRGLVPLTIDGLAGGAVVASASADVTVDGSGHGSVTMTLHAASFGDAAMPPQDQSAGTVDMAAADLATADLALAHPPDLTPLYDLASTDLANEYALTLAAVGGHGTLTVNGQDCLDGCTRYYPAGTVVTVTQAASLGYMFTRWSGPCNGASGSCSFALTGNTTLSALYARSSYTLTVVTYSINGGSGTALPNTGATSSCGSGCYVYPPGTSLGVTAAPASGSSLFAFGGNCKGSSCGTFTMDNDYVVTAAFVTTSAVPNRVFVTSSTYGVAQLGGNGANADGLCQTAASNAGFPSPSGYKAWLSTSAQSALSKLGSARGWVRVDGLPFADTLADVTGSRVQYPPVIDETGKLNLRPAWTGTTASGTLASSNCSDWSVSMGTGYGVSGDSYGGNGKWTYAVSQPCNNTTGLLCFGTASTAGASVTVNIAGTPRRAFTSFGTMMGGGGIASADAACAHDAMMAGLPGSFIAYLETQAPGGGLMRFDTTLGPWALPDGRLLSLTAPTFRRDAILVPVERYADGSAVNPYSATGPLLDWVGAPPQGGNSNSCSDWTSTAGNGEVAPANELPTPYSDPCSNTAHLLCMQQ